jgi:hypothetical protein
MQVPDNNLKLVFSFSITHYKLIIHYPIRFQNMACGAYIVKQIQTLYLFSNLSQGPNTFTGVWSVCLPLP